MPWKPIIGTFGLFLWDTLHGAPLEVARTTAVNTLIFFQIFYLLNARYLKASVLNREGLTGNRYVLSAIALILALQILFTYVPLMQRLFGTAADVCHRRHQISRAPSAVIRFVGIVKAYSFLVINSPLHEKAHDGPKHFARPRADRHRGPG